MFKSLNVSALGRFKVYIRGLCPGTLDVGQAETIRIVSVAYRDGLPEIIGVRANEENNTVRANVFHPKFLLSKLHDARNDQLVKFLL